MKSKLGIQYYLIPLLYIALLVVFIFQYTLGERQSFSFQAGIFSVSGTRGTQGTEAMLQLPGRRIDLGRDLSSGGQALSLQSVEGDQQQIRVVFRQGVALLLHSTGILELLSFGDGDGVEAVGIPLFSGISSSDDADGGSFLEELEHLPGALYSYQAQRYLLEFDDALPGEEGIVNIKAGGSVSFLPGVDGDPVHYWFFRGGQPADKADCEALLRDYLESAYQGWQSGRFNRTTDSWSTPEGDFLFNESALVGLVAEGFRRRDPVDLGVAKGMSTRYKESVSWHSAPYVGTIVTLDEIYQEELADALTLVRSHLSAADPALFAVRPHLVELLLLGEDDGLIEDLGLLFASGKLKDQHFAAEELAGLAEAYIDSRNLYPERFSGFASLLDLLEAKLLPRIGRIDGGLFLLDDPGSQGVSDLKSSLQAGYYLQEIGAGEDNLLFEELGRTMIHSILSRSGEHGILPATVSRQGREGYILPEEVYSLLADNRYVPRNVFLFKELESRVSLLTVGQGISASRGRDSWAISFSFPAGATHHLVVRNVPSFSYLELYGIRWNGTRQFQAYDAGGWYYDRNSETLYLKVRHRRNREEVVIHFRDNTPRAAPVPAPSPSAPAPAIPAPASDGADSTGQSAPTGGGNGSGSAED